MNLTSNYSDDKSSENKDNSWEFYYKACLATYNPGKVTAENEKKYLIDIIDFSRKIEVPLFFVLAPVTDQFVDRDFRPQYFVRNTLYEYGHNLPVLDLFTVWERYKNIDDYYLPNDHGHLNAKGHKLLAVEIKKFITTYYNRTH